MNDRKQGACTKPVFKLNVADDRHKIQPLPAPVGQWPYRLPLNAVVAGGPDTKMVFHLVGDTGSARQPRFQRLIAGEMTKQFEVEDPADRPQFLLHLGDVVYHFGEAEEYHRQFFEPYQHYPAPIFAIAGNHDSDVNPAAKKPYKSLDAFMQVFCDTTSQAIALAQHTGRKSNIQPNIYYTLQTPLATFICLYSNVPKFGYVDEVQQRWFVQELKHAAAQTGKAIIVCIHHAPYSADENHGSSRQMINVLERSFEEANVWPHLVCSGHVHNYQRFSRSAPNGKTVPYIVAGAGGYVTLFPITQADEINYTDLDKLLNPVCLETYCDYAYGFLKVEIEKAGEQLRLVIQYYILKVDGQHPANIEAEKPVLTLFDTLQVMV